MFWGSQRSLRLQNTYEKKLINWSSKFFQNFLPTLLRKRKGKPQIVRLFAVHIRQRSFIQNV